MTFTRRFPTIRPDVSTSILHIGSPLTFLYPRRALQTATRLFEAENQAHRAPSSASRSRARQTNGQARNGRRVGRRGQGDYQDHTGYYSDPLDASNDNIFSSLRRDMRSLEARRSQAEHDARILEARRNEEAEGDGDHDSVGEHILPPDLESEAPFSRNVKGRRSESTMTAPEYQAFDKLLRQLEPGRTNDALDAETRFNLDDNKPLEERLDSIFEKATQAQEERATSDQAPNLLGTVQDDESPSPSASTALQEFPVDIASDAPKLRAQMNPTKEYRFPFPVALRSKYGKVRDTLEHQALVAKTHEKLAKQRAAQQAEGSNENTTVGDGVRQKEIASARKHELDDFFQSMSQAKTDTDIWRILQSRTFAQMQALNDLMDAEKQALQSDATALDLASSANSIGSGNDTRTVARYGTKRQASDLAKRALISPNKGDTKTISTTPPTKSATNVDLDQSPKSFDHPNGVHPLAVLQISYATQLLTALRSLRRLFPHSPYLLAILPEIKRLGPVSYVLGASTDLYNELLYINWTQYRNLHSCADLLKDMMDCGIETNSITWAVWKDALAWRNHALKQLDAMESGEVPMNPVAGALIDLEGVSDGFRRFQGITRALKKRIKADKEMIFEQSGAREELAEMEAALAGDSNIWQAHLLDDMDGRKRVNKMIAERTIPLPEISDSDILDRARLPEPGQQLLDSKSTDTSPPYHETETAESENSTKQNHEREPVPVLLRAHS